MCPTTSTPPKMTLERVMTRSRLASRFELGIVDLFRVVNSCGVVGIH